MPIINKQNIRLLTKVLIEAALVNNKTEEKYLLRSINILKEYIGGEQKKDLQLESLYAIQLLSNELEHPSGNIHTLQFIFPFIFYGDKNCCKNARVK